MWLLPEDVLRCYSRIIPSLQLPSESGRLPGLLRVLDPRGQQKQEALKP